DLCADRTELALDPSDAGTVALPRRAGCARQRVLDLRVEAEHLPVTSRSAGRRAHTAEVIELPAEERFDVLHHAAVSRNVGRRGVGRDRAHVELRDLRPCTLRVAGADRVRLRLELRLGQRLPAAAGCDEYEAAESGDESPAHRGPSLATLLPSLGPVALGGELAVP